MYKTYCLFLIIQDVKLKPWENFWQSRILKIGKRDLLFKYEFWQSCGMSWCRRNENATLFTIRESHVSTTQRIVRERFCFTWISVVERVRVQFRRVSKLWTNEQSAPLIPLWRRWSILSFTYVIRLFIGNFATKTEQVKGRMKERERELL